MKLTASLNTLQRMGNAQLETTLLCSCLALPKTSFILRTCPRNHIVHLVLDFYSSIRKSVEFIVGRPASNWSWQKVTLPSNRDGMNLCCASLHTSAAFLASGTSSQALVERILGHALPHSLHVGPTVALDCTIIHFSNPLLMKFL